MIQAQNICHRTPSIAPIAKRSSNATHERKIVAVTAGTMGFRKVLMEISLYHGGMDLPNAATPTDVGWSNTNKVILVHGGTNEGRSQYTI